MKVRGARSLVHLGLALSFASCGGGADRPCVSAMSTSTTTGTCPSLFTEAVASFDAFELVRLLHQADLKPQVGSA